MQLRQYLSIATLAVSIIISVTGCTSDKASLAASKGSPNEIIVVAEDNLWKTSIKDTVENYFNTSRIGLPQPEPLYKVVQIKLDEFTTLFQRHRNVLNLLIDSTLKEAKYEVGRDLFATPQRVIKISAPTIEELKTAFIENQREIFNLFENAEIERLQALNKKTVNIKAMELAKSKFNLNIDIPADYYIAIDKPDFLWLRREANVLSQGIIMYSYPYTDTNAFNIRKILSVRDQFTRLYVPGPSDSSFMVVAHNYIEPEARTLSLKKELATETRGLWEVKKDFMGGPFLSYTFVDKKNNKVITLDGYVYAPNADKTNLIKQIQAILLSFEFVEK